MAAKGKINLYLECTSDFSIVDDRKRVYTPAEARAEWEAGKVADYNLAFWRLVQRGFDLDAVKAYFAEAKIEDERRKRIASSAS